MSTALAPDEIVVAASFPVGAAESGALTAVQPAPGDFALVAVACTLRDGRLTVGVGGVEDKPLVFDDLGSSGAAAVAASGAAMRVDPA